MLRTVTVTYITVTYVTGGTGLIRAFSVLGRDKPSIFRLLYQTPVFQAGPEVMQICTSLGPQPGLTSLFVPLVGCEPGGRALQDGEKGSLVFRELWKLAAAGADASFDRLDGGRR